MEGISDQENQSNESWQSSKSASIDGAQSDKLVDHTHSAFLDNESEYDDFNTSDYEGKTDEMSSCASFNKNLSDFDTDFIDGDTEEDLTDSYWENSDSETSDSDGWDPLNLTEDNDLEVSSPSNSIKGIITSVPEFDPGHNPTTVETSEEIGNIISELEVTIHNVEKGAYVETISPSINYLYSNYSSIEWVKPILRRPKTTDLPFTSVNDMNKVAVLKMASDLRLIKLVPKEIKPILEPKVPKFKPEEYLDFVKNTYNFVNWEKRKDRNAVKSESESNQSKGLKKPPFCAEAIDDFIQDMDNHLLPRNSNADAGQRTFESVFQPAAFRPQVNEGNESLSTSKRLRCDFKSDNKSDETHEPLNRKRHLQYLDMKYDQEKTSWIQDYVAGRPVVTSSSLTDEHLANELFNMYGPMRNDSSRFKLILRNFRLFWCECIEEWTHIGEEMKHGKDVKLIIREPSKKFREEEIGMYDLNPITNGFFPDLFRFPRDKGILHAALCKDKCQPSELNIEIISYVSDQTQYHNSSFPNLKDNPTLKASEPARTEEKLSIPTTRRKLDVDFIKVMTEEFVSMSKDDRIPPIPMKLRFSFQRNINPHFFGISEKIYLYNFKVNVSHRPPLDLREIRSFAGRLPHIFYLWPFSDDNYPKHDTRYSYDHESILLPACFRSLVCDQQTFLWRIWHLYLVVLSLNNCIIPIRDLACEVYMVFGVQFNCKMWGFESAETFCYYLLESWPRQGVSITSTSSDNFEQLCLARNFEERCKSQNVKGKDPKVDKPIQYKLKQQRRIPSGYADETDRIPHIQDSIVEGMTLRCTTTFTYSPDHFYVSLLSYQAQKEILLKKLQVEFDAIEKSSNPREADACMDLLNFSDHYVVTFYKKEWNRAVTICRNRDGFETVKVFMIDHCYYIDSHISQIRYMPRKFLNFPALGISCHLRIPEELKESYGKFGHDASMLENFNSFSNLYSAITFVKRNCHEGKLVWDVDIIKLRERESDRIMVPDIPNQICRSFPKYAKEKVPNYDVDNKLRKAYTGYMNLLKNIQQPTKK